MCSGVEDTKHYEEAKKCVEELALYLKPLSSARGKSEAKQMFIKDVFITIKNVACRGTWMAQSVKCLTLGFGSDHDLSWSIMRLSPMLGSALSSEFT